MSPGAAGFRTGLVFVVCSPRPHVMRLRPGRPTMGTLTTDSFALTRHRGSFVGANRRSSRPGALTVGAILHGANRRWFRSGALTGGTFYQVADRGRFLSGR
jgi:hypothetical protein